MRNRYAVIILFWFSTLVNASGIPVVDVAGLTETIAQGIARAEEFNQTLNQAKDRLNHYRDMVEGHYNFEDVINDPALNEHLMHEDWKEIYNDTSGLEELRKEFQLESDDPEVQGRYDRQLQSYQAQTRFYESSVERTNKLQNLLDQFQTATTPAAKADLANAIQFEQVQVQNDAKLMETMERLMEKQEILEHSALSREKSRIRLNEGIPQN